MGLGQQDMTAMDSLEIEGGLSDRPYHQRHRSLIDMEMMGGSGVSENKPHRSPHHHHQRHLSVGCMPPAPLQAMADREQSASDMRIFLNDAAMDGGLDDSGMQDHALGSIAGSLRGKKGNTKRRCRGLPWWILGVSGWVIATGLLIFVLSSKSPGGQDATTCTGSTFIPPTPVIPDDPYGAKGGGGGLPPGIIPDDMKDSNSIVTAPSAPIPVQDPGAAEGCSRGRSRPLHGSGAPVCYEGHLGPTDFPGPESFLLLPGDGACLTCVSGNDSPSGCLACQDGFTLVPEDPLTCSGRCVLTARAPGSLSGGEALPHCRQSPPLPTACQASPAEPVLCYDHLENCRHDVRWDPDVCRDPSTARVCQASCSLCSQAPENSADQGLASLLLTWRDSMNLIGLKSPLAWGWSRAVPVDKWPGISLTHSISGSFLTSMNLPDFSIHGQLSPDLANVFRPDFRMHWSLQRNDLSGTLPPEYSRVLGRLRNLDLSRNAISGTIPMEWANPALDPPMPPPAGESLYLNLGNNRIYGKLRPEWFSQGPMRSVVGLNLENNQFDGTLPADWSRMHPELEVLNLRGNGITGSLPAEYSVFDGLWKLHLENNRLSGTLPPEYSRMKAIKAVKLQGNRISGRLPRSWGLTMDSWGTVWNLADNMLTGDIPAEWSKMDMLQLELHGNDLSGPLPTWMTIMTGLIELDLSNNRFDGGLPPAWSALTSLRKLKLANNTLDGTVPEAWSVMVHLDHLDLRGNSGLRGEVIATDGVFVQTDGTSLQWGGTTHATWIRHRSRWESATDAAVYWPDGLEAEGHSPLTVSESWKQDGQCSFCRHLPDDVDKCTCVRDCCDSVGDKSLCSQDFIQILGTSDCPDPCSYCWSMSKSVDRSACFHSCCAKIDDDDQFPLHSDACMVHSEDYYYYYDYYDYEY